jgi:hypothetical protein
MTRICSGNWLVPTVPEEPWELWASLETALEASLEEPVELDEELEGEPEDELEDELDSAASNGSAAWLVMSMIGVSEALVVSGSSAPVKKSGMVGSGSTSPGVGAISFISSGRSTPSGRLRF